MSKLYSWGSAQWGQLGIGPTDSDVSAPQKLTGLKDKDVADISCGAKHTLILLKTGLVFSCGNNDSGQLGHEKPQSRPEQIDGLKNVEVTKVSAGTGHSLALTTAGEVFSWGSNAQGQLGRGQLDTDLQRLPKLIKTLVPHTVLQVACGYNHCLALTDDSRVFVWGANDCGQLGLGNNVGNQDKPQCIACLRGIPVAQMVGGGSHSFILSLSGAVYGWGKNRFGQLGVNDEKDRNHPALCKSLKHQRVKYMSCGEDHTAVLTEDGGVFTFGSGSYGQLGQGSNSHDIVPKKVTELMGSVVTQVACGRRHTLAFVPDSGKVYAFGLGGCGQLGVGNTKTFNTPCAVSGLFVSSKYSRPSNAMEQDGEYCVVTKTFAGGDHCFVIATKLQSKEHPADFRMADPTSVIMRLTEDRVDRIAKLGPGEPPMEFADEIVKIFSTASSLNASFLLPNNEHYGCRSSNNGVDLDSVRENMNKLGQTANVTMVQKICHSIGSCLLPGLPSSPPDMEALRLYLVLPEFHLFDHPKYYSSLIGPFGQSVISLDKTASKVLGLWWSSLAFQFFSRIVYVYKQCVGYILQLPHSDVPTELKARYSTLQIAMEVLKRLNDVNELHAVIPYNKFYISELKDKVDLKTDYINWMQRKHNPGFLPQGLLSFCNYPFVFDAAAKSILLNTDALIKMQTAIDEVQRRNFQSLFLPIDPVNPLLVLHVSRDNLLNETIQQLMRCGPADLKKPMKVVFRGEEAVDEGGVRKEFFLLLLREILDPKYGMFKEYDESHLQWFNPVTFEEEANFHLIGCLCGLAIYNNTIIYLNFPLALYKKLLNRPLAIDDLKELIPTVGRSMEALLECTEDDIEEDFGLTFEVTQECFGEIQNVELVPGGSSKHVNKDNRKEYVDLYIDYLFTKSVKSHFEAFGLGFHKVCGGDILELFHPQELQAMVVGNENYDFLELEKNTEYKGDFHRYHHTIKYFWDIFHDLSIEQKKKFLLYLTGSDRIPISGMKSVKMVIQPTQGGEEYLPVAHTCFNLLDLPKYTSKEKCKEKLLMALEQTEGFGLV